MKTANFWYLDNWIRAVKEFQTLEEAREAAAKEDGVSITIYASNGERVETVEANGYIYP